LLHPFVQRGDAWLSEGLATYLQEVLRVRAGMLPPEQAWRRLYEGALLGRETEQSLAQETRMMAYAGNYQRVYWAGAAIALMADVELRRKTDGKASLDAVLAGLTRDHVGALRGLSAGELLREMDARAGVPVFQDIASRYLAGGRLPDLSALYRELGLLDASDRLGSPRAAPLAWVRDAIMAPHDVALPLLRTPG
jgi:predicted metalloprotease with PDZ domain